MESLLAHIARKERHRLRVVQVDVDERPDLVERLAVERAPTLVLVRERRPVARLEGRASAPRIEAMLEEHLPSAVDGIPTFEVSDADGRAGNPRVLKTAPTSGA